MKLPLAVVERWPMEEFKLKHPTDIVSALCEANREALDVHHRLSQLRASYFHSVQDTSKDGKKKTKALDVDLRELEERLFRLIKFNDYPAMTVAAYSDAKMISSYDYKRARNTIQDDILIRGITTGDYAKHAREHNRNYYFIETGYLGNYRCDNNQTGRKIYHRITKNNMQQDRFLDVPDDRWHDLCRFNPSLHYKGWRRPGSKILLIMSTEKPFEFYGHDRDTWVAQTLNTLQQHTDRPIEIRQKAGRGERTNDTIYDALDKDVWAVITYNSIAAVEAIQYGIPAFAGAPTAAGMVTTDDLSQIENPPRLDENVIYKWLSCIAYSQYSLDEILTGKAWQLVKENEQRPTFSY